MSVDVFIGTNVLLDVVGQREPHYHHSALVWDFAERGIIHASISAISFNNIYYVVRKLRDKKTAETALELLRDIFVPVPLDSQIINQAIAARFNDFEDAIQYYSAVHARSAFLISRDAAHFPRSDLNVLTPKEFLATQTFE